MDSKVKTDQSTLSLIDQFFLKIERFMVFWGGVVIFLIVMISTVNILGRWLFNWPVDGYIDWIEQFMAFFAFLGIAYTQREGGHIRMDMMISRLHGRMLYITELFTSTIILCVTMVLIYGSSLHFLRAYQLGDTSLDIDLPTWPAKLVVPIALSFLAVRLLIQIIAYIRAIMRNDHDPIVIPKKDDPSVSVKSDNNSYGIK